MSHRTKLDEATHGLYEALVILSDVDSGYLEHWQRQVKRFGGEPPQLCKKTFDDYSTAYKASRQAACDRLTPRENASISRMACRAARGHATPFTPFLINPFYSDVEQLPDATDLLLTSIEEALLFAHQLRTDLDVLKAQEETCKSLLNIPRATLLSIARRFYHVEEFLNHGREDWWLMDLCHSDNHHLGEAIADISDLNNLLSGLGKELPDTIVPDVAARTGAILAKLKHIRIMYLEFNARYYGVHMGQWRKDAENIDDITRLMEGTGLVDDETKMAERMAMLSLGGK